MAILKLYISLKWFFTILPYCFIRFMPPVYQALLLSVFKMYIHYYFIM